MMNRRKTSICILEQITSILYNDAKNLEKIGLLDGKMGISIFFFQLAKETSSEDYSEFAKTLLENVCEDIHSGLSPDFGKGISGIGWGIQYLIQNQLLKIDAEEVLAQMDNYMLTQLIKNEDNYSNLNYILGYGAYFLKRINSPALPNNHCISILSRQLLFHIITKLDEKTFVIDNLLKEPDKYQITWRFPFLLSFLIECYAKGIFLIKTEKILRKLIEVIGLKKEWPKKHGHKLLLLWSLSQVSSTIYNQFALNQKLVKNLSSQIKQEKIAMEISKNDFTLFKGTSGIFYLYNELYLKTGAEKYKKMARHWCSATLEILKINDIPNNLRGEQEKNYGLLNGLSGLGLLLLTSIAPYNNNKEQASF